jgi:hypothetical protein
MSEFESLESLAGAEPAWERVKGGHGLYALTSEGRQFATLKSERVFGSLYTGTSAGGAWTFKRSGFFHPHVTVRVAGSEQDAAVFTPRWSGTGALEFPDGRRFTWVSSGFWHQEWSFRDASDQVLMTLNPGMTSAKGAVTVSAAGVKAAELPLLALLGWYLLVMRAQDAAAGGAAAAAAAAG